MDNGFENSGVTKILTIEASGIAIAAAAVITVIGAITVAAVIGFILAVVVIACFGWALFRKPKAVN